MPKGNKPYSRVQQEKPQSPIVLYLLGGVMILALVIWVFTVNDQEGITTDRDNIGTGHDPTP